MEVGEDLETKMEGVEREMKKGVPVVGNNINVSVNMNSAKDGMKMKSKKKKRGQNKKLGIKFQIKKQDKSSLNINKNWEGIKKPEDKRKVVGGQSNTEESAIMKNREGEASNEENTKKPKKPKRRNNRDFAFHSEKMELTSSLNHETEGRTSHRDERTLYVRFPSSLSIREKSYLEPLVPTAVDIRFPRLSFGNSAKFCYIEFKTEEEATIMKDKIGRIEVNGETFYADYVGKKSKAYSEKEARVVDPLRLYVGGLPKGTQASNIRAAFPTATRILYRKASHKVSQSHAYVMYETREEALRVFNASSNMKIIGKQVIVMFATYKNNTAKENEDQSAAPSAKKSKTEDVRSADGNVDERKAEEMDIEIENKEEK